MAFLRRVKRRSRLIQNEDISIEMRVFDTNDKLGALKENVGFKTG